ncbi:unnamed protein product [Amoebophrya sp. A25]|nr:unnamed protein product [Amoebophrya sp. A25]|eukprot:GSA25T00021148001.1
MIIANMMGPFAVLLLSFSLVFATEVKEPGNLRGSSFLQNESDQAGSPLLYRCVDNSSDVACKGNWEGYQCQFDESTTGTCKGPPSPRFTRLTNEAVKSCKCSRGLLRAAASVLRNPLRAIRAASTAAAEESKQAVGVNSGSNSGVKEN